MSNHLGGWSVRDRDNAQHRACAAQQRGAVYLGDASGLHAYPTTSSQAEVHALLSRSLNALRASVIAVSDYRLAARTASDSRAAFDRAAASKRTLDRTVAGQSDTAQAIVDLVGRETPKANGAAVRLWDIEIDPSVALTALAEVSTGQSDTAAKR
ncbi:MAG TPA: hypothetical protein VH165_16100 [Kofleriaceae bacterium]|jgi:hypothetical protein|nr:hypothetical protein [Kofleriaceae bacterium]